MANIILKEEYKYKMNKPDSKPRNYRAHSGQLRFKITEQAKIISEMKKENDELKADLATIRNYEESTLGKYSKEIERLKDENKEFMKDIENLGAAIKHYSCVHDTSCCIAYRRMCDCSAPNLAKKALNEYYSKYGGKK